MHCDAKYADSIPDKPTLISPLQIKLLADLFTRDGQHDNGYYMLENTFRSCNVYENFNV